MSAQPPLVSVIIPTYNRCELVQDTIQSVLAQTFQDFELIVVDDGSTDDTQIIMADYCSRYPQQIRYIYQENAGESVARQHGVDFSHGKFLAFLDSDDLWLPAKLEKQVAFLERYPEAAYVYCWASIIDKNGQPIAWPILGSFQDPEHFSLQQLIRGNFVVGPGSTLLLRRKAYDACSGFNPQIQFAEDWDLCLRLAIDHCFGCVCEPLVQVRLYERGWQQRRENLPRMLSDHLLLVDSIFDIPRIAKSSLTGIRAKAIANRYANAAFAYLAYGELTEGRECLTKACEMAPEQWGDAETLIQSAANYAISLLVPDHPERRAEEFVVNFARSLKVVLENEDVALAHVRSYLYVALANHYWQINEPGDVSRYLLRAMRIDPMWRTHRGTWSLLAKSLLGQFNGLRQTERERAVQNKAWVTCLSVE